MAAITGSAQSKYFSAVMDRYEAKYTIPKEMVDELVRFVSPYCEFDRFSLCNPDKYYTISSLYFDTPNLHFLKQRLTGAESRFNMRIRSYGNDSAIPYFFEIKHRQKDFVRKYRGKTFVRDIEGILTRQLDDNDVKADESFKNINLFRNLALQYNAQPKVLVHYRRMALFSRYDDYARVTFDTDLSYREENKYGPIPGTGKTISCDPQTIFNPGCDVILELKCPAREVPLWMIDCIRAFELTRRGFSKFSTCMRPLFGYRSNEQAFAATASAQSSSIADAV